MFAYYISACHKHENHKGSKYSITKVYAFLVRRFSIIIIVIILIFVDNELLLVMVLILLFSLLEF